MKLFLSVIAIVELGERFSVRKFLFNELIVLTRSYRMQYYGTTAVFVRIETLIYA